MREHEKQKMSLVSGLESVSAEPGRLYWSSLVSVLPAEPLEAFQKFSLLLFI